MNDFIAEDNKQEIQEATIVFCYLTRTSLFKSQDQFQFEIDFPHFIKMYKMLKLYLSHSCTDFHTFKLMKTIIFIHINIVKKQIQLRKFKARIGFIH